MSDKKDWIKEMIIREAIPKPARTETVEDFAKRYSISDRTYYNQARNKENQKKIVELCLLIAKGALPEILQKLSDNAREGKEKSIEIYLKHIAGFTEKLDINIEPLSLSVRVQAEKSIKEFLNEDKPDITIKQQGDDKGSISIQPKE